MKKICTKCKIAKLNTREFFGGKGDGSGKLKPHCRACMNIQSKNYERENKIERKIRDEKRASFGINNSRTTYKYEYKFSLLGIQRGVCFCCYKKIENISESDVDHIIPLSRGGEDADSNILLSHSKCNREKHAKTLVEYWDWRVVNSLDKENLGIKFNLLNLIKYIKNNS